VGDETEVFTIHSDPKFADFDGTVQIIKVMAPREADAALGLWIRDDSAVNLIGRRGVVAYTNDCTIPSAGIYQILVHGSGLHTGTADLECVVDGISVGKKHLAS
jgi:hypothetical protein